MYENFSLKNPEKGRYKDRYKERDRDTSTTDQLASWDRPGN